VPQQQHQQQQQQQQQWCKRCSKCAFIFLLLSAWMDPQQFVPVVFEGCNLLADEGLADLFLELVGVGRQCREVGDGDVLAVTSTATGDSCYTTLDVGTVNDAEKRTGKEKMAEGVGEGAGGVGARVKHCNKPLDCVGTVNEASAAVHLAAVRYATAAAAVAVAAAACAVPELGALSCVYPPVLRQLCNAIDIPWDTENDRPRVTDTEDVLCIWNLS
jgi:hypothetical protein